MIDIHSHILPDLDDGASDWEEALEMCRVAERDGIKTIVASPHVFDGMYNPSADEILEATGDLNRLLSKNRIGLNVVHGADLHIRPDLKDVLSNEPQLTIAGKGRYFLLECPHSLVPPNMDKFITGLASSGLIPIITHPERNKYIQEHKDIVKKCVKAGALVQVTALSITGGFGDSAKDAALYFLKKGLVHAIASDAHSPDKRPPLLSSAFKIAGEIVGIKDAEKMVEDNPRKIIEGRDLD